MNYTVVRASFAGSRPSRNMKLLVKFLMSIMIGPWGVVRLDGGTSIHAGEMD